MDLGRLNSMGKRSNTVRQFDFDPHQFGMFKKRSNAELINGLIGMDLDRLSAMGR